MLLYIAFIAAVPLTYYAHSLKKNTYSFRFSKQANLEEVMKIISQVVGNVNYVIKGNKCYVTSKE